MLRSLRPAQTADSAIIAGLGWRTIGPANFDGRVNAIAGIGFPSKTFYVGAAGGAVWKTTNNGTTFRPLFTEESTASIGAIAIAQSDTNVVWVGTGDPNSRNTIEPGDGVYKSTDGGMTWKLMGLEDGQMVGNIAIDPTNADVVYVAELGHAWDDKGERGLYKTTDGGDTWKRIKYIDAKTGFVDVKIDPSNPNNLFAAAWQRIRGPYFLRSGGPGSGLWHSTDGGEHLGRGEGRRLSLDRQGPHDGRLFAQSAEDRVRAGRGRFAAGREPPGPGAGQRLHR